MSSAVARSVRTMSPHGSPRDGLTPPTANRDATDLLVFDRYVAPETEAIRSSSLTTMCKQGQNLLHTFSAVAGMSSLQPVPTLT